MLLWKTQPTRFSKRFMLIRCVGLSTLVYRYWCYPCVTVPYMLMASVCQCIVTPSVSVVAWSDPQVSSLVVINPLFAMSIRSDLYTSVLGTTVRPNDNICEVFFFFFLSLSFLARSVWFWKGWARVLVTMAAQWCHVILAQEVVYTMVQYQSEHQANCCMCTWYSQYMYDVLFLLFFFVVFSLKVSCLPGRLLTPYVCDHKTLAEACISDDVEFTTMVTLVSWDNASSPVQLHRILDLGKGVVYKSTFIMGTFWWKVDLWPWFWPSRQSLRTLEQKGGIYDDVWPLPVDMATAANKCSMCIHFCSTTEQLFVDGFRGTSVAVNADSSFCVDSGTDTR